MSRENVEVIRRGFELFRQGEPQAFLDYVDEVADTQIELHAVGRLPDVDVLQGKEAAKNWLRELVAGEAFDFDIEPEELIDAGDAVVTPTRQAARGRASGARVTNRVLNLRLTPIPSEKRACLRGSGRRPSVLRLPDRD